MLRRCKFYRVLALALLLAACRQSDHKKPAAEPAPEALPQETHTYSVTGTPTYLPADGTSCFRLYLRQEDSASATRGPTLQSNLGTIQDLAGQAGAWSARLCAGLTAGKVHLQAGPDKLSGYPSLYFIPAAESLTADPVTVARFSATVDPLLQTVSFEAADVPNDYSIRLAVQLEPYGPFWFQSNTVTLFAKVEGTGNSQDLQEVRAEIENISTTGVTLVNPDGWDYSAGGVPYLSYGGFLSADRPASPGEVPSTWTAPWNFYFTGTDVFTVSGVVRVKLFTPQDEQALFRISPFLTKTGADSITVSWETDREARSLVVFGRTPQCEQIALGTLERNRIQDGWTGMTPRSFDSFFHQVKLPALEPGSRYYYRVLSVSQPPAAEPFFSAAGPGSSFSFAVIGDTRSGHQAHAALIQLMIAGQPQFFLHSGDLVNNSSLEPEWLNFFQIEAPLLKNALIFPCLGNHDLSDLQKFYVRYFSPDSPYQNFPLLSGRMYSFDWGNSHFVALDTNQWVHPGSPQYLWLKADLQTALLNPKRKFTFVFQHHPIYSVFHHGQYPDGQDFLEPLYEAYGVDAVFAGHVHLYERSDVKGRPYILTGGGGAPFYYEYPDLTLNPFYVNCVFGSYEFLRVEVSDQALDIFALDSSGFIFDQVHYAKP